MNRTNLKWMLAVVGIVGFILVALREGQPAPDAQWLTSLPDALKRAKAENKPILIDFMADWCKPCHMMTDEVFAQPSFQQQAAGWVLLKVNVDHQPDVAAKYGSSALPTLVVLNADGKPVVGSPGYRGAEYTMAFVTKAFQLATGQQSSAAPSSSPN